MTISKKTEKQFFEEGLVWFSVYFPKFGYCFNVLDQDITAGKSGHFENVYFGFRTDVDENGEMIISDKKAELRYVDDDQLFDGRIYSMGEE